MLVLCILLFIYKRQLEFGCELLSNQATVGHLWFLFLWSLVLWELGLFYSLDPNFFNATKCIFTSSWLLCVAWPWLLWAVDSRWFCSLFSSTTCYSYPSLWTLYMLIHKIEKHSTMLLWYCVALSILQNTVCFILDTMSRGFLCSIRHLEYSSAGHLCYSVCSIHLLQARLTPDNSVYKQKFISHVSTHLCRTRRVPTIELLFPYITSAMLVHNIRIFLLQSLSRSSLKDLYFHDFINTINILYIVGKRRTSAIMRRLRWQWYTERRMQRQRQRQGEWVKNPILADFRGQKVEESQF